MVERRERFGRPVHPLKEAGAVVVRVVGGRVGFDREPDQLLRLLDLARLIADDAERVQGLEMHRLRGQDFAVNAGCIRKPSGAAQLHGILQSRVAHGGLGAVI